MIHVNTTNAHSSCVVFKRHQNKQTKCNEMKFKFLFKKNVKHYGNYLCPCSLCTEEISHPSIEGSETVLSLITVGTNSTGFNGCGRDIVTGVY